MKFYSPMARAACAVLCAAVELGTSIHVQVAPPLAAKVHPLTEKPRSDPRSYQVASLENGMTVINIQDNQSLTSAFAVAVQAGSFDNPDEFPGLAHFCEHMLFLGNEKYPDVGGFDAFVSSHGGYSNAFTATEVTDYFAEVASSASAEGLDRLANFFVSPSFDKQYVSQEVNAVNSEHKKNLKNPSWFTSSIMDSLAAPGNPVGKFSTGDLNTLYLKPMSKGLNPVDALQVWFKDNYCPARMRVATIGPEPLEEQLQRIRKDFANLPAGNETCNAGPNNHSIPEPWPASQLGKWVDIQGAQPQAQLWCFFSLPELLSEYKSSPMQYINWVFSYGGENSLSQKLKTDMGLITGLSMMNDLSSIGTSFWIILSLTSAGEHSPSLVLDVLFSYIAQLRTGVDTGLYQTLADKAKLDWDWTQPVGASSAVSSFAEQMTKVPKEDLLWADSVIRELKPDLVNRLLLQLTPQKMNVGFVSLNMTNRTKDLPQEQMTFPNYNTTYMIRDFQSVFPEALERWSSWVSGVINKTDMATQLASLLQAGGVQTTLDPIPTPPGPIEGVPREIDLKDMSLEGDFSESQSVDIKLFGSRPTKLDGGNDTTDEVWIRSGWVTTSPEVEVSLSMRPYVLPYHPPTSPVDRMRAALYAGLLSADMSPKLFDLEATGASYSVGISTGGVSLSFFGYPPMMPQLVTSVMEGMSAGVNKSSERTIKKFDQLMAQHRQSLATYSSMPYSYALADRNLLMAKGSYSNQEMLAALDHVTLDNTVTVVQDVVFKHPLQATALAMGNVDAQDAENTMKSIVQKIRDFGAKVPTQGDEGGVQHIDPVVNLKAPVELRKASPKVGDENAVTVVTVFTGVVDIETRVILTLLGQIIDPIAYGYLRTTKQLGYVVNAGTSMLSNIMYLSTVVQGVAEPADQMEAYIEYVYTKLMPDALANLSDTEFQDYKSSFANSLLEPPTSASEEFSHSWSRTSDGGHCFSITDDMLAFLDELTTKEPLIEFYNNFMLPTAGPRKRFSVKYFPGTVPARPSKEATRKAWKEAGVTPAGLSLLDREYDTALKFDRADSAAHEQLHKHAEYHELDIHCTRTPQGPPKESLAPTVRLSVGAAMAVLVGVWLW